MNTKPPIKPEECQCPCMWCYRDDPKHDKCGFDCKYRHPTSMGVPERKGNKKCKECNLTTCHYHLENGRIVLNCYFYNSDTCSNCKQTLGSTPLNTEEKEGLVNDREIFSITNEILEPLKLPFGERQFANDRVDKILRSLLLKERREHEILVNTILEANNRALKDVIEIIKKHGK